MASNYCDGCYYQKQFTNYGPYCDYLCMVGKSRPSPPGDGCTARVLKKKPGPQTIEFSKKRGRPKVERTEEEIAALEQERLMKRREYDRMRYHQNREKNLIKSQLYYARNKEKVTARQAEWKANNREKVNQYARDFRKRQKEAKKNGDTT